MRLPGLDADRSADVDMTAGRLGGESLLAPVPLDVLLVGGDARHKWIRTAEPLQRRRNLVVTKIRMVSAIAADDLVHVGVAVVGTAVYKADRAAPEHHSPVVPGMTPVVHICLLAWSLAHSLARRPTARFSRLP
jgi:hypothetical protein